LSDDVCDLAEERCGAQQVGRGFAGGSLNAIASIIGSGSSSCGEPASSSSGKGVAPVAVLTACSKSSAPECRIPDRGMRKAGVSRAGIIAAQGVIVLVIDGRRLMSRSVRVRKPTPNGMIAGCR